MSEVYSSFVVTHAGRTFRVFDLYCPRPWCPCQDVKLFFHQETVDPTGREVNHPAFEATVTLKGRVRIDEVPAVEVLDEQGARGVVQALKDASPGLIQELRERNRTVKAIARRSLKAEPGAALVPGKASALPCGPPGAGKKVGRNEPCPCGSGRKFKKCCGA